MRTLALTFTCLALVATAAPIADAQGPVRRGIRAGLGLTPEKPWQAGDGVVQGGIDAGRNAQWRFQRHNGDWWYYTPDNAWMYHRDGRWHRFDQASFTPNPQAQGQHAAGFRGEVQSFDPQQMVFIDSGGRAVICREGRVTFIDGTALRTAPRSQVDAQGFFIGQTTGQQQFAPGQRFSGRTIVPAPDQAQFQQGGVVERAQGAVEADARARRDVQRLNQAQELGQGQAQSIDAHGQVNVPGQPAPGQARADQASSTETPDQAPQSSAAPEAPSPEEMEDDNTDDADTDATNQTEESAETDRTPGT